MNDSDPFETFAVIMRRSRLGMERAYLAAFAAHSRCVDLLRDHRWGSSVVDAPTFPIFGSFEAINVPTESRLQGIWLEALAEDLQADVQAAPVILGADDTLRRFARGVFGTPLRIDAGGFGRLFNNAVSFTTLLIAATNCLRHVSEWDETRVPAFPYQPIETFNAGSPGRKAMQSIRVLQQAFGIGITEPIRDVVSMRVLVAVDGQLGTAPPSYERFEEAILTAAREIAGTKGKGATRKLEDALGHTMPR